MKLGLKLPCSRVCIVAHEARSNASTVSCIMPILGTGRHTADGIIDPSKHGSFAANPSVNWCQQSVQDVATDAPPEHGGVEHEVLIAPTKAEEAFRASQGAIIRLASDVVVLKTVCPNTRGEVRPAAHEV